jgi:UDP:flavonoid glycosyltransferase YjiC (YdhE family)
MRILVSTTPLDGHFRPLLPFARALQASGHQVAVATEASWHPHVAAEGFDVLPAGPTHRKAVAHFEQFRAEVQALPPEERRPHLFLRIFAEGHATEKLPELLDVARAWRPDAIVYESGDLAAPAVAAVLGVPTANHSFGVMVPLAASERAAEYVAPLWRSVGAEPDGHAGAFRGLYVDLSPPSFAWEQPLGDSVRLGHVPAAPPADPLGWLGMLKRPLVYVTLGTVFNKPELLRLLLEALDGSVSALVTTGRNVDPDSLGSWGPNVRIERFVPQAHVFPLCAAVVAHAGSGSVLGALAHGLPLVLVPQGADQFDNAARCAAAGAAVVVRPEELTAQAVRLALSRILDEPSFAEAARRVQSEIEAMPTPEDVASQFEDYVARG